MMNGCQAKSRVEGKLPTLLSFILFSFFFFQVRPIITRVYGEYMRPVYAIRKLMMMKRRGDNYFLCVVGFLV